MTILLLSFLIDWCDPTTMRTVTGERCSYATKSFPAIKVVKFNHRPEHFTCIHRPGFKLENDLCTRRYLISDGTRNSSCSKENMKNEWADTCVWQTKNEFKPRELVIPSKYGGIRFRTLTCGDSWHGEYLDGICVKRYLVAVVK
jgi:hypothetical protein